MSGQIVLERFDFNHHRCVVEIFHWRVPFDLRRFVLHMHILADAQLVDSIPRLRLASRRATRKFGYLCGKYSQVSGLSTTSPCSQERKGFENNNPLRLDQINTNNANTIDTHSMTFSPNRSRLLSVDDGRLTGAVIS